MDQLTTHVILMVIHLLLVIFAFHQLDKGVLTTFSTVMYWIVLLLNGTSFFLGLLTITQILQGH